jgi:hypothetical protein
LRAVVVRAGYGEIMPEIFNGNIREAFSVRSGVNMLTTIDAYDGAFSMQNSFTSQTIRKGAALKDTLKQIARDLVEAGKDAVVGGFEGKSGRGTAFFGPTWKVLGTYTDGKCFMDSRRFFALEKNEARDCEIPVIGPETGLLGTPRRAEASLEVEMIFEPRLVVGQAVKLQSTTAPEFNRTYIVIGIEHRGTISEATAGAPCVTKASLYFGTAKLKKPGTQTEIILT